MAKVKSEAVIPAAAPRPGWLCDLPFYACVLLFFAYLLNHVALLPLCEWDEARNVLNAYEMTRTGDWTALHFGPELDHWNLKPPFFMWTIALLFKLFGYSEVAARVPSLVFGMATVVVIYHFLRHVGADRASAAVAGFALVTARGFFGFHGLTSADVDIALTFFNTVSLVCVYLIFVERRPKWFLLLGASLGLGFMTKSVVGLIPAGLAPIAFALNRDWKNLANRWLPAGVAISLAIILPWLLLRQLRYDDNYLRLMYETDIHRRSSETIEGHYGDIWFYYDQAVDELGKWVYLGFWALATMVNAALAPGKQERAALLRTPAWKASVYAALAFFFYYAVFSASVSKLRWYMFPAYPALFMTFGLALSALTPYLAKSVRYALLAILLASNLYELGIYNSWRAGNTGVIAVDHLLFPYRKLISGKKIVTQGDMHQNGFCVARIYSDGQHVNCAEGMTLEAMLQAAPGAEFLLTTNAGPFANNPRLQAVRVVNVKGQANALGLFRILPPEARR